MDWSEELTLDTVADVAQTSSQGDCIRALKLDPAADGLRTKSDVNSIAEPKSDITAD